MNTIDHINSGSYDPDPDVYIFKVVLHSHHMNISYSYLLKYFYKNEIKSSFTCFRRKQLELKLFHVYIS